VPRLVLVLLVALVALVAAAPAAASEQHPTLAELESEVMCPQCHEPLNMSDSAIARRIEAYIQRRIDAGATKSQIKHELVEQFGPQVLADPPRRGFDLVAWLLPLAGAGAALLAIGFAARHWTHVRGGPPDVPLDPELESRVDEALARYES
jgi:cytochrome c-type biogenesis protein CcmH